VERLFFNREMRMLDFFRIKLHGIGLILKNKEKAAARVVAAILFAYIKMIFVYVFGIKMLGMKPISESAVGFKFNFYSYKVFLGLFEEIFIYKTYYFPADSKSPRIIDCGSNIGVSLLYFKMLYPEAEITAFEADRDAFAMLQKNVTDNRIKKVKLINKALYGIKNKKMKFYASDSEAGNPVNGIYKRQDEFRFREPYFVLSDTLSGYILKKVDFLKMDIEGAEYQVLKEVSSKGKLKYLQQSVIEYHHHIMPGEDRLGEVLGLFEKDGFGYQISTWVRPPFFGKKFQDLNIYFYKK
jgi:FkbM family methyltransferase